MLRIAVFALLAGVLVVSAKPYAGGASSLNNGDSSNNRGGNDRSGNSNNGGGRNLDALAGHGLRDKVINLGTKNLGTSYSQSGSTKVEKSRKDNWYNKNFENTVTSNLKTVRKQVHTDTKILVKKPLTVDNLHVNQHTNYVKNIYPHLQKLWVERYGEVIKPSHLTQVSRSASASKRTVKHALQVSSSSRSENLGVKREGTRDLGVNNLGNNSNNNGGGNSNNNNNSGNRGGNGNSSNNNNNNSGNRGNSNNNNSGNNNGYNK